jgi:hypothetical protein
MGLSMKNRRPATETAEIVEGAHDLRESLTQADYLSPELMQKENIDLLPQAIQEWLAKGGGEILKLWVGNFQGEGCRRRATEKKMIRLSGVLAAQAVLAEFEKGMAIKIRLRTQAGLRGEALEKEMASLGFAPHKVKYMIAYTKPAMAACAWVSQELMPNLKRVAIYNQCAKFRRLICAKG